MALILPRPQRSESNSSSTTTCFIRSATGAVVLAIGLVLLVNLWLAIHLVHSSNSESTIVAVDMTMLAPRDGSSSNKKDQQQQQQQASVDDDSLEGYKARVKDRFEMDRQQSVHGGAFVHIGKTGGSSLSVLLRNGCHSWLKHPCRTIGGSKNETLASKRIESYYHVADFGLLPQSQHDFYLLTLRDPFDRTVSAFVYEHYLNVQARNETANINARVRRPFQVACTKCFPTLERFVALNNGGRFLYPYRKNEVVTESCQDLARAVFHGRVRIFHHLYFNYQKIKSLLFPDDDNNAGSNNNDNSNNKVILVTRLENLWSDWDAVNRYLAAGAKKGSSSQPQQINPLTELRHHNDEHPKHIRNTADLTLPVTRELSEEGKKVLCRMLQPEYDAYFWFISRAQNLDKSDIVGSLLTARERCPHVGINFKAMHRKT